MPQILKDVGLSPLGPISERNCLQNADDPIPRVTVDVSVLQDLKEVAEAVRLAESAPMPKTFERIRWVSVCLFHGLRTGSTRSALASPLPVHSFIF